MLTRMQDIKAGKLDEDSIGLNNVESALARINVPLRDSKNSFRDFSNVLEDVAKKWDSLNDVEQANISKSIAGIRQAQTFTILMQNMTQAQKLQEVQANSTGLAQERYAIYLNGAEAAQNKVTASWEGMWQATMNAQGVIWLEKLIAYLLDATTAAGGLVTTLGKLLIPALFNLQNVVNDLSNPKTFLGGVFEKWVSGVVFIMQQLDKMSGGKLAGFFNKQSQDLKSATFNANELGNALKRLGNIQPSSTDTGPGYTGSGAPTEESQKAYDELLKQTIAMIKQEKQTEIDGIKAVMDRDKAAFDAKKTALKDELDRVKRVLDQKKQAAKDELDNIKRIANSKKESLKDDLDGYLRLIDNQKELLNQKKTEAAFNREMADKQKNLADIQNEMASLQFDNSPEAIARMAQLKADAAKAQEEIDTAAADRTIELQNQVLDNAKQNAQDEYDLKVRAIEKDVEAAQIKYDLRVRDIENQQQAAQDAYDANVRRTENEYKLLLDNNQAKIDAIKAYADQEGTIANDARKRLSDNTDQTYKELVAWNQMYGDGITATITNAWLLATAALQAYTANYLNLQNMKNYSGAKAEDRDTEWPTYHHSGVQSGNAGGLKNDEVLSVLTKDEIVFTPQNVQNLMGNLIKSFSMPDFKSNMSSGGMNIENLIRVDGNVDRNVVQDLNGIAEKVVQQLNSNMRNRGFTRTTSLTSI